MKKLNLVLFVFALMMFVGIVLSLSVAIAEDQQTMPKMERDKMQAYNPCGDPNCGTDKPCKCGNMCNCPAVKKDKFPQGGMMCPMMKAKMEGGKGMDMMKMDMGKGMMCQCPMMDKMKGDMPMNPMPPKPMMGPDIMAYADKLNLTQDQRGKINALMLAHKKDMIQKNADREIAQVEFEEIMRNDDPDLKAVSDQLKKIANMEADIKFAQIKFGADIKAILTKEQKDNLKMIMSHERSMNMPMGDMGPKGMPQQKVPEKPNEPSPNPMNEMKMK